MFLVYYPEVPMKSAPENKAKTEESDQTKGSVLDQTTTTVQQPSTKERADLINGETSVNQSRRLRALSVPAFADSPASANINNQVRILNQKEFPSHTLTQISFGPPRVSVRPFVFLTNLQIVFKSKQYFISPYSP